MCNMISPGDFFHFFKILIFWVVVGFLGSWLLLVFQNFDFLGVKGQKMVQNDKKLCHAPYLRNHMIIIMVHMCKIISPGVFLLFFIFSKFSFLGILGEQKG